MNTSPLSLGIKSILDDSVFHDLMPIFSANARSGVPWSFCIVTIQQIMLACLKTVTSDLA